MATLITGAGGFIGFHTAKALLEKGEHVLGIDNLNDYYDPQLKTARLAMLANEKNFSFAEIDIADMKAVSDVVQGKKIEQAERQKPRSALGRVGFDSAIAQ